jgi:hypothetical protein
MSSKADKGHLSHRRFTLEGKIKGANIKSFVIRETDDRDDEAAFERAAAEVGVEKAQRLVGRELMKLAIVEVDGQKWTDLDRPAYEKWNKKTRDAVWAAYSSFNILAKDESEGFLAAAEEVAP